MSSTLIPVPLARAPYNVHLGPGLLAHAGPILRENFPALGPACAIITDTTVGPLHLRTLADSLRSAGFHVAAQPEVPSGETSKSLPAAATLCDHLITAGLDRSSFLLALGGGVIGDLAGFVAAIYYRGVPYIQLPTTIVSQVDSSVGGKTGVNAPGGKNLIGAFHQPLAVIADTDTLRTLPPREFHQGLAEAIKHALIRDPDLLLQLETLAQTPDPHPALPPIIARNIAIKAAIVVADEHETLGLRALLNLGHTIGHAIENAAGYGRYLHGEAIALGLRAALHLSVQFAGLDPALPPRVTALLRHFHLPTRLPSDIPTPALLAALRTDKKFRAGQIHFVLLSAPGSAHVSRQVTLDAIADAIEFLRSPD